MQPWHDKITGAPFQKRMDRLLKIIEEQGRIPDVFKDDEVLWDPDTCRKALTVFLRDMRPTMISPVAMGLGSTQHSFSKNIKEILFEHMLSMLERMNPHKSLWSALLKNTKCPHDLWKNTCIIFDVQKFLLKQNMGTHFHEKKLSLFQDFYIFTGIKPLFFKILQEWFLDTDPYFESTLTLMDGYLEKFIKPL